MDIRNLFTAISTQLSAEFKKTASVQHSGGKGTLREDVFRDLFLTKYLPTRYAVGRGEVISPENKHSGQLDIVIYDPTQCPILTSASHSVYPIESVYGAISMKSHLESRDLKQAYKNIASVKQLVIKETFVHHDGPGMAVGMSWPAPVTGIVAYDANRSLESIAEQVRLLDEQLADITSRPDFVAVIGKGIIAPHQPQRSSFNQYQFPADKSDLAGLRKTGRHTLFRLYMQILRELNMLTLKPLDLADYDNMPRMLGKHRVKAHFDRFVRFGPGQTPSEGRPSRLSRAAIEEIVSKAKPVTVRQNYLDTVGLIPLGAEQQENLDAIIYQYNPSNLPPLVGNIAFDLNGKPYDKCDAFHPYYVEIDGKQHVVAIGTLLPDDRFFEEITDFTVDELMSS